MLRGVPQSYQCLCLFGLWQILPGNPTVLDVMQDTSSLVYIINSHASLSNLSGMLAVMYRNRLQCTSISQTVGLGKCKGFDAAPLCMQGRGPKTNAFTHSLETNHHMFMKLDNGKVRQTQTCCLHSALCVSLVIWLWHRF